MSTRRRSFRALVPTFLGLAIAVLGSARVAYAEPCTGLVHAGTFHREDVRWESRVRCLDLDETGAFLVPFAYPLPRGSRIETARAEPLRENDRIVGVRLPIDAAVEGGVVRFAVRVPRASSEGRLTPPLVAGPGPQMVGLTSRELEFEPAELHGPRVGEHRLTFVGDVDPSVPWEERRLAHAMELDGDRFVTTADSTIVEHEGIVGELDTRTHRHQGLFAVLGTIVSAVVLLAVAVYRRIAKRAELEEAEATIRREYEMLGAELDRTP